MNPQQPMPQGPLVDNAAEPQMHAQPLVSTQQQPVQEVKYQFWYLTGPTTFTAKKGIVTLTPGKLTVTNFSTGQEVYSYALTSDLVIRGSLSSIVRISYLNGQKTHFSDKQRLFYFFNPLMLFISYWFMFSAAKKAREFVVSCKHAAGVAS